MAKVSFVLSQFTRLINIQTDGQTYISRTGKTALHYMQRGKNEKLKCALCVFPCTMSHVAWYFILFLRCYVTLESINIEVQECPVNLKLYLSEVVYSNILKCDGQCFVILFKIYISFLAVKEFWRSVMIWRSYQSTSLLHSIAYTYLIVKFLFCLFFFFSCLFATSYGE